MERDTKIVIAVCSVLVAGVAGFIIYKVMNDKKKTGSMSDNQSKDSSSKQQSASASKLEVTKVDWDKKIVYFNVVSGGKIIMSDKIQWEKKDLGAEFGFVNSSNANVEITGANLPNGLVLVLKENGVNKSGKIFDFNSKMVKDYNGSNLAKDISVASELTKKMMTSFI
jgi:hypothetical protein